MCESGESFGGMTLDNTGYCNQYCSALDRDLAFYNRWNGQRFCGNTEEFMSGNYINCTFSSKRLLSKRR